MASGVAKRIAPSNAALSLCCLVPSPSRVPPLPVTRRQALALLGATLIAPPAFAIGERSSFSFGQLQHGPGWDRHPEALRRLLWELKRRTSVDARRDAEALAITDDAIFYQPLLVLMGEGSMAPFNDDERARLLRHLRFGGMLWIDAPSPDDGFARDAKRELNALVPRAELAPLAKEHVLFKSFFLIDGAVGRNKKSTEVLAQNIGDRTAVLMTTCDVLGAFDRDRFGTWTHECVPDGERQRERAFRFGVNVAMYATCLDYKADQVHIPFIMKKKRR